MKTNTTEIKKAWTNAIVNRDADAIMSLYSEKALLKPTLSNDVRNSPERIKAYFTGDDVDHGFLNNGIHKVDFISCFSYSDENTISEVGEYIFHKEGGEEVRAHYTFVYVNNKIVSHHSSLTI